MNEWSKRRKRIIFSIIVTALVVLIGAPLFFLFYRAPTCFDGKHNGDETGIDCGGSCQLLCRAESLSPIIKGDPRILSLTNSSFEVVALIENPNVDAEIHRARYSIKLYARDSILPIKTIEGETYVPKGATFAIFEGPFAIDSGALPAKAVFVWDDQSLFWQKDLKPRPELVITNINLSRKDTNPRLEAVIENRSLERVSNIDITALISDQTGSIFAASKTFIDTLPAGGESPVVFTWPRAFVAEAVDIEIITRVFPDSSFVR